jgi:hypothetical protein
MELCQLESSGMSRCMEEFLKRSDLCCVSACCKCRCICILCICNEQTKSKFGQFNVLLPLSSVKAMIGARVCADINIEITPELM